MSSFQQYKIERWNITLYSLGIPQLERHNSLVRILTGSQIHNMYIGLQIDVTRK